jgi:hypothetical protein
MRSRPWILVLVAGALVVGGCGDDPTLPAKSAEDLHAQVAAVRTAVDEGDRAGALEALDGLQADVKDLEAGGSLPEADADALRRGIGRARRRVRAEVEATAPVAEPTEEATPEPTPEPTATPVPPEPEGDDGEEGGEPGTGNDEEKGKGEEEGKGQEKDKGRGKGGDE